MESRITDLRPTDAAQLLACKRDDVQQLDDRTWRINGPTLPPRTIVLHVVDGEWECGVEITILNRAGVVIGNATVSAPGLTARFVANMAFGLNGQIR